MLEELKLVEPHVLYQLQPQLIMKVMYCRYKCIILIQLYAIYLYRYHSSYIQFDNPRTVRMMYTYVPLIGEITRIRIYVHVPTKFGNRCQRYRVYLV